MKKKTWETRKNLIGDQLAKKNIFLQFWSHKNSGFDCKNWIISVNRELSASFAS